MGRYGIRRYGIRVRSFAPLVAPLVVPLVALMLLLSGCGGATTGGRGANANTTPTHTPRPTLAWHPIPYPKETGAGSAGIAVSRLGAGIWACAPTQDGHLAIWSASTPTSAWQQIATLSPPPAAVGSCQPVVDANDPHALTVEITWGSGEAGTLRSLTYFSPDGVTWRQLPGYLDMRNLASAGGKRFALLGDTAAPPSHAEPQLVVSTDDLRTWQTIRPKGLAANDTFFAFWLDPSGTQLLAASTGNTLWMTMDTGTTWTQLSTHAIQTSLAEWLSSTGRWKLCGWTDTQPQQITCSADLGKTWQTQPTFTVTDTCGSCGKGGVPYTVSNACIPGAIQTDGALVAICGIDGDSAFTDRAVYRLAPGATTWTTLGRAPGNFFAASDAGQLWCVDTQGQIAEVTLPA